jgi:hypothetical protein
MPIDGQRHLQIPQITQQACAYTGAYEWRRGAGWRQLTGESPLDPGPTFDELKTIVADPEWRDDPDEKATTVAMECVRELKEDSENS